MTCYVTATSSVYRRRETMSDFFKQTNNLLQDFFLDTKAQAAHTVTLNYQVTLSYLSFVPAKYNSKVKSAPLYRY